MPTLIHSSLVGQLRSFLTDNEVEFKADTSKDALRALARSTLESAGVNPEFYDFDSGRSLAFSDARVSGSQGRLLPPPPPFDLAPSSSQAKRWEDYVDAFEVYASATKLASDEPSVQRSTFLHIAGPDIKSLVPNLTENAAIVSPLLRIQAALKAYFLPERNKFYERLCFMRLEQNSTESADAFVSRLRAAARVCEFATQEEGEMRVLEQFLAGAQSAAIRKLSLIHI